MARSAIDAVRELQPDVVLLDIRLPDVDGFQVAERLAANGAARRDRPHLEPRQIGLRLRDRRLPGARLHPQERAERGGDHFTDQMTSPRRAMIGLAIAAFALGVGALVAVINGQHNIHRGAYAALALGIGWGFTGTGLYAWRRRPASNIGPLMIAVGFAGLLKALAFSSDSVIFTIGSLGEVLIYALLIHLLLSFPSGRLDSRLDRVLVAIAYFNTTVVQLAAFVLNDPQQGCAQCPANPLLIDHADAAAGVINAAQLDIAIAVLGAVVAILYRRWRDSSHESTAELRPGPRRRQPHLRAVDGVADRRTGRPVEQHRRRADAGAVRLARLPSVRIPGRPAAIPLQPSRGDQLARRPARWRSRSRSRCAMPSPRRLEIPRWSSPTGCRTRMPTSTPRVGRCRSIRRRRERSPHYRARRTAGRRDRPRRRPCRGARPRAGSRRRGRAHTRE